MKIVAIVQARMGSTRLPNKVMKKIGGVPMIELLLARLAHAAEVDEIVVATSEDARDQPLVDYVSGLGYRCCRGSEDDVLARFVAAAREVAADVVVRITGDCPLVDPELVDEAIRGFRSAGIDYFSNVEPPSYPDGLDIEVFTRVALERAEVESNESFDHEHVTPYLRSGRLPSLTGFSFRSQNALAYKTLITQEMLAKNFLASNSVYVCTEHTAPIVDAYFEALDPIFSVIRECEDGRDIMSLLKGPICHGGFKRLN